ncbi:MAG TPA: HNH endonuclease [Saprospiraceae bacterium]|nr:HNH endonuclease [Saprospiraceae bacterium]
MTIPRPDPDGLTQERLKELLHYNSETGLFTRKVSLNNKVRIGDVAGCYNLSGYVDIRVDVKKYKAHRLAFLYMLGRWPYDEGEHKDGDGYNNKWDNLRDATHAQNMKNRKLNDITSTGYKGVYQRGSKWRAKICVDGEQMCLGVFDTIDSASEAYYAASKLYFGDFARNKCDE